MVSITNFGLRILLFGISTVFFGSWFHELSHWSVGRIQTKEMEIQFKLKILPHRVVYGDLSSFSKRYLQLTALAPQLILLTYVILNYLIYGVPSASDWLLLGSVADLITASTFFAAIAGGVIISPADLIAIFCQHEFRNWEERGHDEKSHIELTKVLMDCLRSN